MFHRGTGDLNAFWVPSRTTLLCSCTLTGKKAVVAGDFNLVPRNIPFTKMVKLQLDDLKSFSWRVRCETPWPSIKNACLGYQEWSVQACLLMYNSSFVRDVFWGHRFSLCATDWDFAAVKKNLDSNVLQRWQKSRKKRKIKLATKSLLGYIVS